MRTHLSAALVAALATLTPSLAHAGPWDLVAETIDPRYDVFRLDQLRLRCKSDGIIAPYACGQLLEVPAYPQVGTDDKLRSIIPRPVDPNNPAAGMISELRLGKVGDTVQLRAPDLGIWYDLTFAVKATRAANDVIRWEGLTPQNFCVMQDYSGIGRRVVRVSEMGANLCTAVKQAPTPADSGDKRFYKQISLVDNAGCNVADPALDVAARDNAYSTRHPQNFVTVGAWFGNPDDAETTAYDAQLAREREAARALAIPEPDSTTLILSPARCMAYADRAGPIRLTLAIDGASGDVGRDRVSSEIRNPRGMISIDEYVCRESADPRLVFPLTLYGDAYVSRPVVTPTSADEAYELGRVPATDFRVELAASLGASISPSGVSFPLGVNGDWESPIQVTLGSTLRHGTVVVSMRSPTLGGEVLAERTITVTTSTRCQVPRHRLDRLPPYILRKVVPSREPFARIFDALVKTKIDLGPRIAPTKPGPGQITPVTPR